MKWLSKLRDPNPIPLKVRTFITSLWLVSSLCVLFANADWLHNLAAIGIASGVFGAGILYYETIVTDRDLEMISKEIAYSGGSTKLSLGEIAWVIGLSLMMVSFLLLGIDFFISKLMLGTTESALQKSLVWVAIFPGLPRSLLKFARQALLG